MKVHPALAQAQRSSQDLCLDSVAHSSTASRKARLAMNMHPAPAQAQRSSQDLWLDSVAHSSTAGRKARLAMEMHPARAGTRSGQLVGPVAGQRAFELSECPAAALLSEGCADHPCKVCSCATMGNIHMLFLVTLSWPAGKVTWYVELMTVFCYRSVSALGSA